MGTKDRRQTEKENRQEMILHAAEKIMAENGLYGLNIDLVAAETQLAKGTIYLYFKSKEAILSTLTGRARKMLLQEFEKIARKPAPAVDKLKAIIQSNYQFYRKRPLYYDLVSLYEANNTLIETAELHQVSEDIITLVSRIAEDAKSEGTLHPSIDPIQFTFLMWGTTVGMLQLIKVKGDLMKKKLGIKEKDLLATYTAILINGIKP